MPSVGEIVSVQGDIGIEVGLEVGSRVGNWVGAVVELSEGTTVGDGVGILVWSKEGAAVGLTELEGAIARLGKLEGVNVGKLLMLNIVGSREGTAEGNSEGAKDNGMADFLHKLWRSHAHHICNVQLMGEDIVRHKAVSEALKIYDEA